MNTFTQFLRDNDLEYLIDKLEYITPYVSTLVSIQDEPVSKRRQTLVSIQDEPVRVFTSAKIDHEASLNLAGYRNFMKQSNHPRYVSSLKPRDMDLWMIKLTQKDREEWIQQISPQNKNDSKKLSECDNIWQDIRKQNKKEESAFASEMSNGRINYIDGFRKGRAIFFIVPSSIDLPDYSDNHNLSLRNFDSLRTGKSIFYACSGHYREVYYAANHYEDDLRRAETGMF